MSTTNRRQVIKNLLAVGSTSTLASCAGKKHHADLGMLYDRAAQRSEESRNPIILVPGILGSYLKHEPDGERVWGVIGKNSIKKHTPLLAHPMEIGKPLNQLHDDVVADGVLRTVTLSFGARVQVQAYAQLIETLGAGGYQDQTIGEANPIDYGSDHYTCFQFGYDWRRSCAENAAKLDEFLKEKREYVREQNMKKFGRPGNLKFDLVAHSMGGLITRYYQMYGGAPLPPGGGKPKLTWAGTRNLNKVILVAPPNAGSCEVYDRLRNGLNTTRLTGRFSAALTGTLPTLYELLPRERHNFIVDENGKNLPILDPDMWQTRGWGLADPNNDKDLKLILPEVASADTRRRIALDHQRKCLNNAAQFQAAIDHPTNLPANAGLYLFAGDSERTARTITVQPSGDFKTTKYAAGDYAVSRSSALLDERDANDSGPLKTPIDWTQVTFIAGSHLGLTKDPSFTDNMLYILLEKKIKKR